MRLIPVSVAAVVGLLPLLARSQETSSTPATPAASSSAPAAETSAPVSAVKPSTSSSVTLTGYVEAFYQWNFNRPSNGVTALRAFDTRHNSFTLANAVLDTTWSLDRVVGRLALQIGHTPQTYYLAEPRSDAAGGVGASSGDVWKFIQQANVGFKATSSVLVEAGLFLSPIGPESMAIKDQWNWSRSNLFYGLPFYHTGVHGVVSLSDTTSVTAMVCNGWNNVVDNNEYKSVMGSFTYNKPDKVMFQALYFGGVERTSGAPEGNPWRHLLDAYVFLYPTDRLAFLLHGDAGFEKNHFGTSWWGAAAAYARFKATDWLYLAARGDRFYEKAASNAEGTAASIFWPSEWVTSGTFTVDTRPAETVSIRLEYRHDQAQGDSYFKGTVLQSAAGTFLANAKSQDTLTVGATTWF